MVKNLVRKKLLVRATLQGHIPKGMWVIRKGYHWLGAFYMNKAKEIFSYFTNIIIALIVALLFGFLIINSISHRLNFAKDMFSGRCILGIICTGD